MSEIEALVLGVVQGTTEFLPVSSSGHLVVLEHIWQVPETARLPLTVALHVGTALAVVVFFARRLVEMATGLAAPDVCRRRASQRMVSSVAVASIPAAAVGLGLGDIVDRAFGSPVLIGICLLLTGAMLFGTRFAPAGKSGLNLRRAVVIGLAQAVATLPGISRSGATIAAGLYCGLDRREAFEFSFLLSVPAVLGAVALELPKLANSGLSLVVAGIGAATALASGVIALWLLRRAVSGGRLHNFAWYCWLVGLSVLVFVR